MDLIANWKQIIETNNEKAIIPFLKRLNEAQKQALLPSISKTAKSYLEIKDRLINNKHIFAKKASNKQERMLNYSILVCSTQYSHPVNKWLKPKFVFQPFVTEHILPWYCPIWLNDYVNDIGNQDFVPLTITYETILEMHLQGYLAPNPPIWVKLLARIIFPTLQKQSHAHQFDINKFATHPIIFKKHFWYFFQHESLIHSTQRNLNIKERENLPSDCWYFTIDHYIKKGKLAKIDVLKACLLATQQSIFNKSAMGWFMGLFDYIRATEEELLILQEPLFATYTCAHSKVTNTALKGIRKIVGHSKFKYESALNNFEKLLLTKTKSIVKNALLILEKLVGLKPALKTEISKLTTKTFIHREESLQLKAAKIILNCEPNSNNGFISALNPYIPNLFSQPQQLLIDFLPKDISIPKKEVAIITKKKKIIAKENEVDTIQSYQDFEQLTLKIFDNQTPYHFDQFMASLLQFQGALKGEKIGRLTSIFRKAYKLVFNELPSNHGMLDNILAIFFLDLADFLIGKYPKDAFSLRQLAETYLEQGFFINEKGTPFDLNYAHLYRWYNPFDPSQVYMPYKKMLAFVLTTLHQGQKLPLLSTPTHRPTWIDPLVLVEKLKYYQEENHSPNEIDLQLAISRLAFENRQKAVQLAKKILSPNYAKLIEFTLTPQAKLPKVAIDNLTSIDYAYFTAAITKDALGEKDYSKEFPDLQISPNYFNGVHDWMVFWEDQQLQEWNPKISKFIPIGKPYIHTELQIKFPKPRKSTTAHPEFLYQYFPGNGEAFRPNVHDIIRLLGMLPNNPEPLIALLVSDNLKYPTFWEEVAKRRVWKIIAWLTQYNKKQFGKASHLFLSACMICSEKKIRFAAAKIWETGILQKTIDPDLIGQILGKMERKAFAPLQRFTNLAQNQLFNLSAIHNLALEKIIANLLAKLPAIPIKNTKKLLLLYRELLIINQSSINKKRLIILLGLWNQSPSLRPVLKELSGFVEISGE